MSYKAIVVKLKTRPHTNADKLQLGTALGNQVVIGLDVPDGSLGAYFPCDGKLSLRMLQECDLLPRFDVAGQRIGGGFFSENGRVRAQKFRGEKSDGFWLPLSQLAWTGANLDALVEGTQFDGLNGIQLCEKYMTPATLRAQRQGKQINSRRETLWFKRHVETAQFRYEAASIKPGALITITEKIHGTSQRQTHTLDTATTPLTRWERIKKRLGWAVHDETTHAYTYLTGTRNVILGRSESGQSFYGSEQFRHNFAVSVQEYLHKGETLYLELAGYQTDGGLIMCKVSTDVMKDKAIKKQYGDTMVYTYGASPGQAKAFIYRNTMTNPDGVTVELSDAQMRRRCEELDLTPVPLLCDPFIYDGNEQALRDRVETLTDGPSTIDPSHIREGVVVRADAGDTMFLKNKSHVFKVLEGIAKETDDYVDVEESA